MNRVSPLVKSKLRVMRQFARGTEGMIRDALGMRDSETKLAEDSDRYWNETETHEFRSNSHWKGSGAFRDSDLWYNLGRFQYELLNKAISFVDKPTPTSMVEWGCGGGMNAVHWVTAADRYYGVDISTASLAECQRQVEPLGREVFCPVLIEAEKPEEVFDTIDEPCDVFLCTYVFELLPSPEYGMSLLKIARRLTKSGGVALIQIRYHTGWRDRARAWSYARGVGVAQMASYRIDEFWGACEQRGWLPQFVHLIPKQPELKEERYAYFALQADANES